MKAARGSLEVGLPAAGFCVAYLTVGLLANLVPANTRALAAVGLMSLCSAAVAIGGRRGPWRTLAAQTAAILVSIAAIYCWRRLADPLAVVGPIPSGLEPIALTVLGAVLLLVGGLVGLIFSPGGRAYRFRWVVLGAIGVALLPWLTGALRRTETAGSPQALLQHVVLLEQSAGRNSWAERQELSTALTMLGRQREARQIPLVPNATGHHLFDPGERAAARGASGAVPWRSALTRIAAEHRLVLIMEAHTITEHRAWIEQTLETFRAAGFSRYCAEAVTEPGSALRARGYPAASTGFYTLDPRFGNLLRTALHLGFEVDGYDLEGGDFERREEYQATRLAELFTSRPGCKMVVHVGHGHLFKHEVRGVGRYMAARLWEKTGVEPYTIWQLSNDLPGEAYQSLLRRIGPITEPVMLNPPPPELTRALFPDSAQQPAVDAVVVHPPRLGQEPADRRGAFASQMVRVAGVWKGSQWPVVIAALPTGEPDHAVALDQIMLRSGETDFELWLPRSDYRLRVWGLNGPISCRVNRRSTPPMVEITP